MKNIHLIPTDKSSRLWTNNLRRRLELDEFPSQHPTNIAKHIYITSDEEIKEGEWYENNGVIFKADDVFDEGNNPNNSNPRVTDFNNKIILTDNKDLIKDGVQKIDNEFLEWFVKNPSCEEVEIESWQTKGEWDLDYKIIIPKEEHKITNCGNKNCQSGVINGKNPKLCKKCNPKEEPKQELERGITITHVGKQETLEEAVEQLLINDYKKIVGEELNKYELKLIKWLAASSKKYSEEDMFEFSQWISHEDWVYLPSKGYWVNEEQEELEQKLNSKEILNMWFEKFKKK